MKIPIQNCGSVGIIKDVLSHQLPANAWTAGTNVLMRDGAVHSIQGQRTVLGTPLDTPEYLQYYQAPSANWWLYAGNGKIHSVNSSFTHTDVSGSAYATTGKWQGTFLNGVAILNNGVDRPQQWGGAGNFATLSNWDTNNRCKVIRSFGPYLFALGMTESGTFTPTRLIWSDQADPGAVPGSWDYTDATVLAGRVDLASEGGHLLDLLPQQQYALIYKEKSVIRVQLIGGISVFKFDVAFSDFGVMTTNCVVDIEGSHAVFSDRDLIVHNGSSIKTIVEGKVRRDLYKRIDRDGRENCFTTVNKKASEVWFCFPTLGSTYADEAVIYNYKTDTVSFRELAGLSSGALGDLAGTIETWDTDTEVWDDDLTAWNELSRDATKSQLLVTAPAALGIYQVDTGYSDLGNAIRSTLERTEMVFEGITQGTVNTITRVYPEIFSVAEQVVKIWVGGRMDLQDPITWCGPYLFRPAVDSWVDCVVTARWHAIRFEFEQLGQWRLGNYIVDIVANGEV